MGEKPFMCIWRNPQERKRTEVFRSLVQHEDQLREGRINWLLLSQTMLLATFAQFYAKTSSDYFDVFLTLLICVFGLFSAFAVDVSLAEGREATRKLKDKWDAGPWSEDAEWLVWVYRHDRDQNVKDHNFAAHIFLPKACMLTWAVFMCVTILKHAYLWRTCL